MDNRGNPASIRDNQSPLCYNIDLDQHGKISKRRGSKYLFSTAKAAAITWMEQFRNADGTTKLVYTTGTDLRACDVDGTSDASIVGALTLTTGQNYLFDSVYCTISGGPAIVGTNDQDAVWYWTGSGNAAVLSTVTAMPTKAKCVEWFENYLILANIVDRTSGSRYTNYFTWSAINAPTDWSTSASNFIRIGSATDPIVAIQKFQNKIEVLKEHSIWLVTYSASLGFVPELINPDIGCAARNTVAIADDKLFFLSHDGVYAYQGNLGADEEAVMKISNQLEAESWETNWHTARKDKACAAYYRTRNQYRIFIAEGATQEAADQNRTYYAYHTHLGSWTKGGTTANCAAIVQDGSRQRLYVGDYSGQINRLDYFDTDDGAYVDNDNGTAIDAYWYTKDYDMGMPGRDKGWHKAKVTMSSTTTAQTLTVGQYTDYGDFRTSGSLSMQASGALLDEFVLDVDVLGGGSTAQASLNLTGYSETARFKLANSNNNEHFTILALSIEFEPAEAF